jgi:hypothetical protein
MDIIRPGFLGLCAQARGAKITVGRKATGHALLFSLARGLSRCLIKPLTQWNGN